MEAVFGRVLQMSMHAGIAVLIVLGVRFIFQKFDVPKKITCYLWYIPIIRMICPVFFESRISLIPGKLVNNDISKEVSKVISKVSSENLVNGGPTGEALQEGIISIQTADVAITYSDEAIQLYSIEPMHMILIVLTAVWIVGIGTFLIYGLLSLKHLHRKLSTSIPVDGENSDIYWADYIDSPFVYGFFRPQIYLPYHMKEVKSEFVIAHERAHIKRKDHIFKITCYIVTIIHWFNPLVWIMLIYLCKDMEMACDEMVMQQMGEEYKADYAQILLDLSTGRRMLRIPLAFGEGNTKERIHHILRYKNPAKVVVTIALVSVIAISVAVLTSPIINTSENAEKIENSETVEVTNTDDSETKKVLKVPDKNKVLEMQSKALSGMEDEEAEYIRSHISRQNMRLEYDYIYDNHFASFEDPEAEVWNYFDQTGEIVIEYAFDTEIWEKKDTLGLTEDEFEQQYGQPVYTTNKYDADAIIELLSEMQSYIHDEQFKADFDNLMELVQKARDTHDVKYLRQMYYILHDMDYFLLRYGMEALGPGVQDKSTLAKYYGVLEVYKGTEYYNAELLE